MVVIRQYWSELVKLLKIELFLPTLFPILSEVDTSCFYHVVIKIRQLF
jgi:hypothetical protein